MAHQKKWVKELKETLAKEQKLKSTTKSFRVLCDDVGKQFCLLVIEEFPSLLGFKTIEL